MNKTTLKQYDKLTQELIARIAQDSAPLPESQRAQRVKHAGESFIFFITTYLPHHFEDELCLDHIKLSQSLQATIKKLLIIEAFRGFGKTTIVIAYALWRAIYKQVHFCALISDTEDQASLTLALTIKTELEYNQRILQDFGTQKTTIWNIDEFVTKGNTMFKCFGRDSKFSGRKYLQWRPDLSIVDDFENIKNVKNRSIVRDGIGYIEKDVIPGMTRKEWQMFYVGTPKGRNTVLSHLQKNPNHVCFSVPVYRELDDKKVYAWKIYDEQVCEEIIKTISFNNFRQEYLLDPISEDDPFQEHWIKYYTDSDIKGLMLQRFIFFDPSFKTKGTSYKAIVSIGVAEDFTIYVLRAFIRRVSVNSFGCEIYADYETYHPMKIGGEVNAVDEFMEAAFKQIARQKGYEIPLTKIHHSTEKWGRIVRLQPYIERGRIKFKKGDSDQDKLVDQLLSTPPDPSGTWPDGNDGPDALEGAVSLYERTVMRMIHNVEVY